MRNLNRWVGNKVGEDITGAFPGENERVKESGGLLLLKKWIFQVNKCMTEMVK